MKIIIYTDGGARGNPGPAAIGVSIHLPEGIKNYGEAIGIATNNIAEYKAAIFALKKTKVLLGNKAGDAEIEIRSDSELMVKQINGEYRVKDEGLKPLFMEIWNEKQDFKKVEFKHIAREENKDADASVNKALDGGLF